MSFQAWDWLWYPVLWFQWRNSSAHGAENSIQTFALAGVEPRTLASSGPRILPLDNRTPPLMTCRRLQQDNSNPKLAVHNAYAQISSAKTSSSHHPCRVMAV